VLIFAGQSDNRASSKVKVSPFGQSLRKQLSERSACGMILQRSR
jgi:hypothetical protein